MISTVDLLVGVDLGPLVVCYLACKVTLSAQRRLIFLVIRRGPEAREGVIVDFADNQCESAVVNT